MTLRAAYHHRAGSVNLAAISILWSALLLACHAQTVEVARVTDATGNWASNGAFTTVTAIGQPGPAGCVTNPACINWSGFLNSFLMFPALDHDHDGLPDENDPDDDNDGLADTLELSGSAFNPLTTTDPFRADSDQDGMSDAQESAAGTNPLDTNSLLRITRILRSGTGVLVTWQSREGYTYDLMGAAAVWDVATNAVAVTNATASMGTGVWRETVTSALDSGGGTNRFYRIRLTVP
jgi:hypothetical protein